MSGQITISIWLFLFLLAVTAWAVLDRILIPSTRWFLRRRINRVIDEINLRLDIQIKPFQLTKRRVLIDRLIYDPKVMEAIQAKAKAQNSPREVVLVEALSYAKEIVPSFNAYIYFRFGYWLAKRIARLLYWVSLGFSDDEKLAEIDPDSTVVFVMNHRSNMDYILVSFLAAEKTALSYAVGEWAKIWPLQTFIRALGAFFVRRNSGNPLYRRVLERYVYMATHEGVCQAVFLEGGLSRDGRLRPPKLGFLDYMVRGYEPDKDRDIIFIPVGINYDRTLEDRSLLRALDPQAEKRSKWFVIKTTVRFLWRSLVLIMLSRWQRFGYACVNFGSYVSVREYCRVNRLDFSRMERTDRFNEVQKLAEQLITSIKRNVPVLPVSLVSAVMLDSRDRKLSAFEVQAEANRLLEQLGKQGAPLQVFAGNRIQAILNALNMLKLRKLVQEDDGFYQADSQHSDVLSYYANSIAHWRPNSTD